METHTTPSLVERLHKCGLIWTEAHDAPLTRLGRLVVNDGGLLQRIGQPGVSVTTATLEKCAAFLAEPANWLDGAVPQDVIDLAHVVGVSAPAPALSAGKVSGNSREEAA
jgi:hypothetical protein